MRHREFDFFGWPFVFDFDIGKGRRRGRRGQWFESGDMKYVILKLLKDRPMHGYEVMKELEERTRGCYKPSPGTVYPTLQWLEDEGLVRAEEQEGKKVYHITEAGLVFLDEHRSTVEEIFDRVAETIDRVVGEPMPEVNRAVARVVSKAYRAAWKLGDDAVKVSEILDRAADELDALLAGASPGRP
jgi:DNA-binding PadR family transcriptional regulator